MFLMVSIIGDLRIECGKEIGYDEVDALDGVRVGVLHRSELLNKVSQIPAVYGLGRCAFCA